MSTPHPFPTIWPVLLSGGDDGGFWPAARQDAPGWLQPIFGDRSPLQEATLTLHEPSIFRPPLAVVAAGQRFLAAQQFAEIGVVPSGILLEPASYGALAAAAAAVAHIRALDPSMLVLIAPADQAVRPADRPSFRRALRAAAADAAAGRCIVFAAPSRPWLQHRRSFGPHLIDAGWLLAQAGRLAEWIEAAAPGLWDAAAHAVAAAAADLDFSRLDADAYAGIEPEPFESLLAVAAADTVVHALDFTPVAARNWSDLMAASQDRRDQAGNLADGDAVLLDATDCYVRTGGRLTTLAGVRDLTVIVTDDAVLVADARDPTAAGRVARHMAAANRPEAQHHLTERRPWGDFTRLTAGERYQVKRITVAPGAATSLQRHHHRAEHWVVVAGTAEVTVDGTVQLLRENEAAYLPLGAAHRLANPGMIPLELIEVQSGAYLGEDDIVRLDDPYRRDAV